MHRETTSIAWAGSSGERVETTSGAVPHIR
jgi:hypothetical protein